jgi:hypothetical protein
VVWVWGINFNPGESDGLYVVGLASAGLGTIVDVGTQPYTGPLTWLNGTFS